MLEEFEDFKLFKISELKPDDIILINTSTLFSTNMAEACKKQMNELFPNNKWVIFNSDDLRVTIENYEGELER